MHLRPGAVFLGAEQSADTFGRTAADTADTLRRTGFSESLLYVGRAIWNYTKLVLPMLPSSDNNTTGKEFLEHLLFGLSGRHPNVVLHTGLLPLPHSAFLLPPQPFPPSPSFFPPSLPLSLLTLLSFLASPHRSATLHLDIKAAEGRAEQ